MASIGPPPLTGIKVLEFAGLAPGPYAGMLLADAGASVLRIDRPPSSAAPSPVKDLLTRRKASLRVDLGSPDGAPLIKHLIASAPIDVLIDPFRPGVLERLGLGPAALLPLNPRLIYARLTGFRRDGRYANIAGHEVNYLAVSGALSLLGRADSPPTPSSPILGDFAGGGAALVQGILLALLARQRSGRGQVVEANVVDGVSHLATFSRLMLRGLGRNLLDGGCPFYDTYETRDGKFLSVGALEPSFFRQLLHGLGLGDHAPALEEKRFDPDGWPAMRALFADTIRCKTRAEWEAVFDGTDACALPVLDYNELADDPAREGDQRPMVTLHDTPCLAIRQSSSSSADDPVKHGQGPGVPGDGYDGEPLEPGDGGPEMLRSWLGWEEGRHHHVRGGAFVLEGPGRGSGSGSKL